MFIPSNFPACITNIPQLDHRTRWQGEYLKAYQEEFSHLHSQWYALKATITGVCLLAATLFSTIMMASSSLNRPFVVASSISIFAIGTTVSICTMIYYGCLAEENEKNLKAFPNLFPLKFEVYFQETVNREQKDV